MKKIIFSLTFTFIIAGVLFTGCNSPEEKLDASKENVEEAQQNLDEAKAEYAEQYNKFKLESEEKITANEKVIADLKVYSKTKKSEARIAYDKSIADLEARNEAMKVKVGVYKEEGNEKWQSFKDEFNHDMNELGDALKDLTKDNKK